MAKSPFRYSKIGILFRKFWRRFFPMPTSPYTKEDVTVDICKVNLVPPRKLRTFFAECLRILHKEKGKNIGDYFECGVFNGSSIAAMFETLRELKVSNMRLFGCDSFEGLPPGVEKTNQGVFQPGFYKCNFDTMKRCLYHRGVDSDRINWVKGWYNKTLNQSLIRLYSLSNLGIVFIDCDSYESSKDVLDFIAPLIKSPVIIVLDDWGLYDLDLKEDGEYKSFNEFVESNPHLRIRKLRISYSRKARTFLVSPK